MKKLLIMMFLFSTTRIFSKGEPRFIPAHHPECQQEAASKIDDWLSTNIKQGRCSETKDRKEKLNTEIECAKTILYNKTKDNSFKDKQEWLDRLEELCKQRAKNIALERIKNEATIALNNILSLRDYSYQPPISSNLINRGRVLAHLHDAININDYSLMYYLLKNYSESNIRLKLKNSIEELYGKKSSWYPVTPSALPYSYKEQQDEEQGKAIVSQLKDCQLKPHCWAVYSMYKNGSH